MKRLSLEARWWSRAIFKQEAITRTIQSEDDRLQLGLLFIPPLVDVASFYVISDDCRKNFK